MSQVNISWWGDDADGYIVGYEFYIGDPASASEDDWEFTAKTDSVFILPIPEGSTDADVTFSVRAVDNAGDKDETPSSLIFPIRNTAPSISFNVGETPPDTTYGVASFGFTATDPDGDANLNRIEIALNDTSSAGAWVEFDLDVTFLTLDIDFDAAQPEANVLIGKSAVNSGVSFNTVNVNGDNKLFIRTFDNAASESQITEASWYVKEQTSKVLFLNDYFGTQTEARKELHLGLLNDVGITKVDYIDISDGRVSGGTRVPLSAAFHSRTLADPTINLTLSKWDYIYWVSDDLNRNIGYALEITQKFFEDGGKMFVNIPVKFISSQNSLFQFLPFQAIQEPIDERNAQFILRSCSEISASTGLNFTPDLRFKQNVFPTNPIIPFQESVQLFEGDFKYLLRNPTQFGDYDGVSVVSSMNPEQTILYFGFDLSVFTTASENRCTDPDTGQALPPSDLEGLIEFITIETLGFEE